MASNAHWNPTAPVVSMPVAAVDSAASVDDDRPFRLIFGMAASCFIGALACDLVYWRTPDYQWTTFAVWLLTVGLIVAGAAALVGLIDRVARRHPSRLASKLPALIGLVAVVVVEIFNAFVHSRDAYVSVVPDGLALSILAVLLLVLTPIAARAFRRSPLREATR